MAEGKIRAIDRGKGRQTCGQRWREGREETDQRPREELYYSLLQKYIAKAYKRMPGKELKSNYPPCNRAFALRMMNPMSYQQGHMSPLDGEIQPVVKKSIAKSITERRGSENSFDDISLSPASSLSSFQDMELYDIDENNRSRVMNGNIHGGRLNSSYDSYRPLKRSPRVSVTGKSNGNGFISRSYSSSDGFSGSNFQRGATIRVSTPARTHGKSASENGNEKKNASMKSNGFRPDVTSYLQNKTKSANSESSLRRSQSLRERSKKSKMNGENKTHQKDNISDKAAKIRVAGTRSSHLRAKVNQNGTVPSSKQSRTDSGLRKKHSKPTVDDLSESDNSAVYSEMNAYNPRNNPRNKSTTHHTPLLDTRYDSNNTLSETSSIDEYDSALQMSTPSTPSTKPCLSSSPVSLKNSDRFSTKLNDVCQIITTEHPNDFHIIETLVEMQTAYEERNKLVTQTISDLRHRVNELESKKVNSAPNIPALVIPLMRATTTFQSQLQSIMDSQHSVKNATDKVVQTPKDNIRKNTLDEISLEAYAVAAELEKLSFNQKDSELPASRLTSSDTMDSYAIITDGSTEV